jgi:hypothetical protein
VITQVTRLGVSVGRTQEIEAARTQFARQQCILLPQFLAPDLLARFQQRIAFASFELRVHDQVTPPPVDLCMNAPDIEGGLHFLVNDQRLFRVVESITDCGLIGCYLGAVYKMVPGQGHYDTWHDDLDGNRLITLSVNLSAGVFEGGALQLMDWDGQRLIHEVANTGAGDAILFQLSPRLKHRLTEVIGTLPKVALAGWFRKWPRYEDRFPRTL